MAASKIFFNKEKAQGCDTITLLRAKKWRGFLGGSPESRTRDRVVLRFSEIEKFLEWELTHNIGVVGNMLVEVSYPPMGGHLSEVICALVAAHWEIKFKKSLSQLKKQGFCPTEVTDTNQLMAGCGFVDDINFLSGILCGACQGKLAQRCLPKEIGYGIKSVGTSYKFLNAQLWFSEETILLTPANASIASALGLEATQVVGRIPPNLESSKWNQKMISAYIKQRCAVNRQLFSALENETLKIALTAEWDRIACLELQKRGYSAQQIIKDLASFAPAKNDQAIQQTRTFIRTETVELN